MVPHLGVLAVVEGELRDELKVPKSILTPATPKPAPPAPPGCKADDDSMLDVFMMVLAGDAYANDKRRITGPCSRDKDNGEECRRKWDEEARQALG